MPRYYEKKHQIQFYEVDVTSHLTLSSLLNLVIAASGEHLEEIGVSSQELIDRHLGWVVTQYHMSINKMPETGQTIYIKTAAMEYNRYFCYRSYWLYDDNHEELLEINSVWIMLDLQTRKMVSSDPDIMLKTGAKEIRRPQKFPRIKLPKDQLAVDKSYFAEYFNIDENEHVSNSHYFDWMISSLPLSFIKSHQVKSLDIKYEHEILYHDSPKSHVYFDNETNKSYHKISNGDLTAAECIIQW
ncbi:acyl-[acyl-carrier-protein] thioesterase [Holzapfeliella sp. JNUCC 72]